MKCVNETTIQKQKKLLFGCLKEIFKIDFEDPSYTKSHQAVYTCDNWESIIKPLFVKEDNHSNVQLVKNLFLMDKKLKTLFHVIANESTKIELNKLSKCIGVKNLRFASDDVLESTLHVEKGSVTPLALFAGMKSVETETPNAQNVKQVHVILDQALIAPCLSTNEPPSQEQDAMQSDDHNRRKKNGLQELKLLVHPLTNSHSTVLSSSQLITFLDHCQVASKRVYSFEKNQFLEDGPFK